MTLKENVQLVCEAIAGAVNMDVTVVDAELVRMAGTGAYSTMVGERISEASAFGYARTQDVGFIIENPGTHAACRQCAYKSDCPEHAEVCAPIRLDGSVIGVIGLIAFHPDQRRALIEKKEALMTFLDRMADLIAAKFKEQKSLEVLELLNREMKAVFESLDTGLVAVSPSGEVLRVNKRLLEMLGYRREALTHLRAILGKARTTDVLALRRDSKHHYHTFKNGVSAVYDVTRIEVHGETKGFVIAVSPMASVIETVNQLTMGTERITFEDIIGVSDGFCRAKQVAQRAAHTSATVLLLGESGTGKELFARAIHNESSRRLAPFVAVNCAAIPDQLLESELFGYEEGAFTGARRGGKPGKFQLADGGTLFLDEIGDMPLHLQGKLLRALEEKQVERLGGKRTTPVDVRIVAATHRDLEEMAEEGTFRSDLLYRIQVIPIAIPPLRARKEDILPIADAFVKAHVRRAGKGPHTLEAAFKRALCTYTWPGNVREMSNAMEYAVTLSTEDVLSYAHLPQRIQKALAEETSTFEQENVPQGDGVRRLAELERDAIAAALAQADALGGMDAAAQKLGISRATLYRKIKTYNLQ